MNHEWYLTKKTENCRSGRYDTQLCKCEDPWEIHDGDFRLAPVQACSLNGVFDKIRFFAREEGLEEDCELIISSLVDNPIDMFHDPQDEDEEDQFELQRYLAFSKKSCRILYIEFDSRFNLKTSETGNYVELIWQILCNDPDRRVAEARLFFSRSIAFEERSVYMKISYPSGITDTIGLEHLESPNFSF